MLKLAAFADEISPELDEQIAVCKTNGVMHIDLRAVYGKNVLDFDAALRNEIKSKFADNGLKVLGIGSPVGKVKITENWDAHFDRFKIAVELAHFFDAPYIRIFSYYPDDAGELVAHRDEIMRRTQAKLDYIKDTDLVLLHENEVKIYGDIWSRCLDLMQTINSPKYRMAFDFANFIQAGEYPIDCWPALKPYTAHIHIKDAMMADGSVKPAGQGEGKMPRILRDAWDNGYRGFLSLEPHLAVHGQFGGFSGPGLFKVAADAIKDVCRQQNIPLDDPSVKVAVK
jgi:sugar phosphate isomerase/epimerase